MKRIYGKKHWRDRLKDLKPDSWSLAWERMMKECGSGW
jgi:hypothetical protein